VFSAILRWSGGDDI